MSFIVHRVTKQAARYTDAGGREKCGYCRFFVAPRSCGKVIGPVSPMGWCKYFSQQMISQFGGSISAGGGATFDQSLLGGSLGPGAVFTRASTGTYYDSAGVLRSAAIDGPRFDYDPVTLAMKGLLLEDQSTNLLLNSGNAANASWTPTGGGATAAPVATANQSTAPDGTATAARVVYPAVSGAGAFSYLNPVSPVASAIPYAFSVWLKGNVGGERVYLATTPDGSTYYNTQAFLTTSWQRFSLITPNLSAIAWYFTIGVDMRDPAQTAIPAQTIYAWGAQVEALPYTSSHIPTTTVSVTRAADSLRYPIASVTGFSTTNGTYLADCILGGNAANLPNMISGDAGSPVIAVGGDARLATAIRLVVGVFGTTGPQLTFGAINKAAFGYKSGASLAAVNGVSLGTNAATFTVGGTTLQIGLDGVTNTNSLNGWARRVAYWPRQLTQAELISVTT